ncbi:hypothetical protein T492DRAFT_940125 [Pavlovales sp. CCMP2436]|nr:hypothetical protein T492DRAFT_940125 [Pavlovales sp. CCMP2436]
MIGVLAGIAVIVSGTCCAVGFVVLRRKGVFVPRNFSCERRRRLRRRTRRRSF